MENPKHLRTRMNDVVEQLPLSGGTRHLPDMYMPRYILEGIKLPKDIARIHFRVLFEDMYFEYHWHVFGEVPYDSLY